MTKLWNPANLQSTSDLCCLLCFKLFVDLKDLPPKPRYFRLICCDSCWSFAFQNGGILSSKGMLLTNPITFSSITSSILDGAAWCFCLPKKKSQSVHNNWPAMPLRHPVISDWYEVTVFVQC